MRLYFSVSVFRSESEPYGFTDYACRQRASTRREREIELRVSLVVRLTGHVKTLSVIAGIHRTKPSLRYITCTVGPQAVPIQPRRVPAPRPRSGQPAGRPDRGRARRAARPTARGRVAAQLERPRHSGMRPSCARRGRRVSARAPRPRSASAARPPTSPPHPCPSRRERVDRARERPSVESRKWGVSSACAKAWAEARRRRAARALSRRAGGAAARAHFRTSSASIGSALARPP